MGRDGVSTLSGILQPMTDDEQAAVVERVLSGSDHEYATPETCSCTSDLNCPICNGGLTMCRVCGLAEGSLTTECPKYLVSSELTDVIYQGKIDYRFGRWEPEPSPHSPKSY